VKKTQEWWAGRYIKSYLQVLVGFYIPCSSDNCRFCRDDVIIYF